MNLNQQLRNEIYPCYLLEVKNPNPCLIFCETASLPARGNMLPTLPVVVAIAPTTLGEMVKAIIGDDKSKV